MTSFTHRPRPQTRFHHHYPLTLQLNTVISTDISVAAANLCKMAINFKLAHDARVLVLSPRTYDGRCSDEHIAVITYVLHI